MAIACSRNRSGIPCQTAVRSKKSNVRARLAIAWTVSIDSASTPATTLSIRPRIGPSSWLASRTTVTVSARSASTAATTSEIDGRPLSNSRRTRLRDSTSTG